MTPRAGQSLGGRPVTETVTPVNVGNQPHCDNGEGVATASPLPSRLKTASIWGLPFQPSASRTTILPLLIPAVNCWATFIRPLRGLGFCTKRFAPTTGCCLAAFQAAREKDLQKCLPFPSSYCSRMPTNTKPHSVCDSNASLSYTKILPVTFCCLMELRV